MFDIGINNKNKVILGELTRKLKIKVKSQQIMYKRDGVVRLSQSTVPKYGVNVHNVRVHLIDISFHEICDLALIFYRHNTRYREMFRERQLV